jgi:hypothetical protein
LCRRIDTRKHKPDWSSVESVPLCRIERQLHLHVTEYELRGQALAIMSAITVFRRFPKKLFRVNNGPTVLVRPQTPNRHVYDIITSSNGFVEPKATNPLTYIRTFIRS